MTAHFVSIDPAVRSGTVKPYYDSGQVTLYQGDVRDAGYCGV